ncbi:MAG: RluA family pseudouridine synthase [Myxococcales bacterium]|nr:RluA family pseudouridine synthase [Myxococcales bacterium]
MPELLVGPDDAGTRLDKFLRRRLPGMPLSHIYKLLRTRKVRLNGKRARAENLLAAGDRLLLHVDQARFSEDSAIHRPRRRPARLDFSVVFEDEHLLVVMKPPFLPAHPGAGHREDSLIDQVHAYLEVKEDAAFRPALAHRLDRDTSGLVLVGKTGPALRQLNRLLHQGEVHKSYLGLVRGVPQPSQGAWDMMVERRDVPGFVGENRRGRPDKPGRTEYRVALRRELELCGQCTPVCLLTLHLLTGRTHQLRSHLFQAGHPLLGDPRYGDEALNQALRKRFGLRRQFLHAYRLSLPHPVSLKPLRLASGFPADLEPLAQHLRLGVPE